MNVLDFGKRKTAHQPISMVTCYDYWSARVLNATEIDTLLVGDSLAMVMHGFDSTVHATVEMMALHVRAVRRGAPDKFVVGDMPFLSVRKGQDHAMDAVGELMQAGSNAVKIEGEAGQLDLMAHIVESGVPVMGHLGLTPQSVEAFGGHKVQGRNEGQAGEILESARRLEEAGCFALVLECIPSELGRLVSREIGIPTIGIGAGPHTDGQGTGTAGHARHEPLLQTEVPASLCRWPWHDRRCRKPVPPRYRHPGFSGQGGMLWVRNRHPSGRKDAGGPYGNPRSDKAG